MTFIRVIKRDDYLFQVSARYIPASAFVIFFIQKLSEHQLIDTLIDLANPLKF